MKTEDQLRLQAYLDNEVSSSEARQIAAWIARDAEAKALFEELQATKAVLNAENELPVTVPESRDFYWSKIQRGIEQAEREPAPVAERARPWWIKLLAPVAGAAVLALFVFTSISTGPRLSTASTSEDQSALENGTITFHSKEHGMTVVWMPSSAAATTEAVSEFDDDFE